MPTKKAVPRRKHLGHGAVTFDVTGAREGFADTLNRVAYGKERVIVQRRGKAVAAVIPLEDLQTLEEAEDRLDAEEARKALADPKNRKRIPLTQVKRELGL